MSPRTILQHVTNNDVFMLERNAYIKTLAQDIVLLMAESKQTSPKPDHPKRLRNYQKLIPNVLIRTNDPADQSQVSVEIAKLHSLKGLCKLMHYQVERKEQLIKLLSDPVLGTKELHEIEKVILRFTRVFPACYPGTPLKLRR